MNAKSFLTAGAFLVFGTSVAQAQFVQQGGFRLRDTDAGVSTQELFRGFGSDLGVAGNRISPDVGGTFVLGQSNRFSFSWDHVFRTWSFSYAGFNAGTAYTLVSGTTAPTFDAFRFQLQGNSVNFTQLSSLQFNGAQLLGAAVPGTSFASLAWGGLNAAESFAITGDLTFGGPGANNEAQRFELDFGTGTNLDQVPGTTVPEPSTYALMAAGLAALGLAVRRRRSIVVSA